MRRNSGERLGAAQRFRARAVALWRFFFPPAIELDPAVVAVLSKLYPRLDLTRVSFHLGLPHVYRPPTLHAITLPAAWGVRRTRIFLRPSHYRPNSTAGLGLLVHETFHAQQLQDAGGGWGLGLLRPFFVLYLACAAGQGFRYRGHPLEEDAYALAGEAESPFERCCGVDHGAAEVATAHLARESSNLAFGARLLASTPLGRTLARAARALASWRHVEAGDVRKSLAALGLVLSVPLFGLAFGLAALWLAFWIAAAAILALTQMAIELAGALVGGAGLALSRVLLVFGGAAKTLSSPPRTRP